MNKSDYVCMIDHNVGKCSTEIMYPSIINLTSVGIGGEFFSILCFFAIKKNNLYESFLDQFTKIHKKWIHTFFMKVHMR